MIDKVRFIIFNSRARLLIIVAVVQENRDFPESEVFSKNKDFFQRKKSFFFILVINMQISLKMINPFSRRLCS